MNVYSNKLRIRSERIATASCANPERPLTYSGPVPPQSFDLTDTVLLGRLLALAQLTLPQYAVLFSLMLCKEALRCIM